MKDYTDAQLVAMRADYEQGLCTIDIWERDTKKPRRFCQDAEFEDRKVDTIFSHQPYDAIYQWMLYNTDYADIVRIAHTGNDFTVIVRK